jgi:uncharacterized protein DUF4249
MQKTFTILTALVLLGSIRCKQAYDPPVISSPTSYLVVEGFINNGPDSTYYTLSHTFALSDTATSTPELHAQVTVQGKDNSSYTLTEIGNGVYGAPLSGLNNAVQYRLHILTTTGKEYASDYVEMKVSPPIDSVSWTRSDQGVQIYDNTHDPQGNSRYYRWSYQETWQFNSTYFSTVAYTNGQFTTFNDTFYTCWQSQPSTSILLGSSAQLAQDRIQSAPLVMIPMGDWRLSVLYSIMVNQYVLTPDAYTWWQSLQRNTEQIGSIFGVQPSTTGGNIHNLADSTELVLGYVSGGTLAKQRIYITAAQVSPWDYNPECTLFSSPPDSVAYYLYAGFYLVAQIQVGSSVRYDMSFGSCVNCTILGVNHKPSFWP